jgi:hypothetical protein
MRRNALTLCCLLALPVVAQAGGPLRIADPEPRIPYRYTTEQPVRIYTDVGKLGPLTQAQAQSHVAFSAAQWSNVETSSFAATAGHTFADLGLGDIHAGNADAIIGTDNGGGIHVVFDDDGSILRDVIGAPPGVLGIAMPELAEGATLLESFVLLNGAAIDAADTGREGFAGVVTHELGHAINLAHTQTNGAALFGGRAPGPANCTLPFAGQPSVAHLETMYPYVDLLQTGAAQATVDHRDDRVALSNLYPAPGWLEGTATIRGHVRHQDGGAQLTGVNVVARNVDDPFADAVSALSGDYSQGRAALRDGSFVLRGLTPGARYVLHIERVGAGSFSTPKSVLPMGATSEEYWNATEHADPAIDDRCMASTIVAGATQTDHDIVVNGNGRAQSLVPVPINHSNATDVSNDGRVVAGALVGQGVPGWRWRVGEGVEMIPSYGPSIDISGSGEAVSALFKGPDGILRAGVWRGGTTWQDIGGGMPLTACTSVLGFTESTAFDISDDGSTVIGYAYRADCLPMAYRWDAKNGVRMLAAAGRWSRADAMSADMQTIIGWNDQHRLFVGRFGVQWRNGRQSFISPDPLGAFWGDALAVNGNGSVIVGTEGGPGGAIQAWRWTAAGGPKSLGVLDVPFVDPWRNVGAANVVSRDGNLVLGSYGFRELRALFLWTPQVGLVNFGEFLWQQGIDDVADWFLVAPSALSADATTIVGLGVLQGVDQGWYLRLAEVSVCDLDQAGQPATRTVTFPDGMNAAVSAGALLGRCDRIEG